MKAQILTGPSASSRCGLELIRLLSYRWSDMCVGQMISPIQAVEKSFKAVLNFLRKTKNTGYKLPILEYVLGKVTSSEKWPIAEGSETELLIDSRGEGLLGYAADEAYLSIQNIGRSISHAAGVSRWK